MKYRLLGRTGVSVSPLCLGTMMFGPWGNADETDSIRIIHQALDAGINFVDTAEVYSAGESERVVGKALASTYHFGDHHAGKTLVPVTISKGSIDHAEQNPRTDRRIGQPLVLGHDDVRTVGQRR